MKYAETAILYPPTDFAAEVFGNDNVKLAWSLPIEGTPTAYKLYRDGALLANVTELTYNDYNIPVGTHRYTLSAIYPEGESVQVGPVVVETTEGLDNQELVLFHVYPTHVNSTLTIESDVRGVVTLYNMAGQQIMTRPIHAGSNILDVSSLTDGVYFIKSTAGKTVKIVKY